MVKKTERKPKKPVPSKFIQIVSSKCLTALDSDGRCWLYQGDRYGWSPLNMRRLTIDETVRVRSDKRNESEYSPEEEEYPINGLD